MKQGYTHITFVLDNSGSMSHLAKETISGYNQFKKEQTAQPGKLTWSLYEFREEEYHNAFRVPQIGTLNCVPSQPPFGIPTQGAAQSIVINPLAQFNRPVTRRVWTVYEMQDAKNVPDLDTHTYICNTNTPLLDAIAVAIDQTGKQISSMTEEDRPEKVIVVILTDGEENHSMQFTHAEVMEKITHQTEVYKWQFIYLGANQDAIQVGVSFGINAQSSMTYCADAAGIGATYHGLGSSVSASRSSGENVVFTSAMRAAAMSGKTDPTT